VFLSYLANVSIDGAGRAPNEAFADALTELVGG
jgi:hypothetical protein